MSYSLTDLEKEIIAKIEAEKGAGNERIVADWVAHAVIADHPNMFGEDREFYAVCTYRTVRESTRRVMSKYRKNEIPDELQMTLEGFEYLQTYYVLTAKGEDGEETQVQVHVSAMTYEELTAKAEEHARAARAHDKHAEEIYRFRDAKFSATSHAG